MSSGKAIFHEPFVLRHAPLFSRPPPYFDCTSTASTLQTIAPKAKSSASNTDWESTPVSTDLISFAYPNSHLQQANFEDDVWYRLFLKEFGRLFKRLIDSGWIFGVLFGLHFLAIGMAWVPLFTRLRESFGQQTTAICGIGQLRQPC